MVSCDGCYAFLQIQTSRSIFFTQVTQPLHSTSRPGRQVTPRAISNFNPSTSCPPLRAHYTTIVSYIHMRVLSTNTRTLKSNNPHAARLIHLHQSAPRAFPVTPARCIIHTSSRPHSCQGHWSSDWWITGQQIYECKCYPVRSTRNVDRRAPAEMQITGHSKMSRHDWGTRQPLPFCLLKFHLRRICLFAMHVLFLWNKVKFGSIVNPMWTSMTLGCRISM